MAALEEHHLDFLGVVPVSADDPVPPGTDQLMLLGPLEPGFWQYLNTQAEWLDKAPDPIDRWSERAIKKLANQFGGQAVFPFGGPPFSPFIEWALRSTHFWRSPVTFLVHDRAGLMVSLRGAIAFQGRNFRETLGSNPCESCATRPCLDACPGLAFAGDEYDPVACRDTLSNPAGKDCMSLGCAVRRACPISKRHLCDPSRSAHHMKAFTT